MWMYVKRGVAMAPAHKDGLRTSIGITCLVLGASPFVPKIGLEALYCKYQHAKLLFRFRVVTPHANTLLLRRTEGIS
jgi:hypothetical protein